MLSCLNNACAGCDAAVKQQFNAIVNPLKTSPSCRAGATCASSSICSAPEPLTCNSGLESSTSAAAGTSRMSCRSALLICFLIFASMHFGSSCDVSGMQTCNQAYLAGARTASGNETCAVLDTMLSCLNNACAGCDAAVKQQFNAIVNPLKSSASCQAGATCASSSICSAPEPLTCNSGLESSTSAAAGTSRANVLTICITFAVVALFALNQY